MNIKEVSETIWNFYNVGRSKSTSLTLTEADILQYVKMALSGMMRQQYLTSKKIGDGNEYYFYSQILSIKNFPLSDPDNRGMRRASMDGVDLYRLPQNMHLTNIYPKSDGCLGSDGSLEISQVSPGEENFYLSGDYDFFAFYVVKGTGINTYHLPPCIKSIDVETTYDGDDVEVSLDQAMDIANIVLGVSLKVKGFMVRTVDNNFNPNVVDPRHKGSGSNAELMQMLQDQQSQYA